MNQQPDIDMVSTTPQPHCEDEDRAHLGQRKQYAQPPYGRTVYIIAVQWFSPAWVKITVKYKIAVENVSILANTLLLLDQKKQSKLTMQFYCFNHNFFQNYNMKTSA